MFNFLLKYNKDYQKEQNLFEYIELNISKKLIDRLLSKEGKWVYTQYLPIGYNSDTFECYVWCLKYHYISCVFRDNKLISKKMKRRI